MEPAADRALLFTDVVDSTSMVARLGDVRAAQLWAEHDRRARTLLAAHHGREIDRSDGFLLLFDAVADAARFALALHAVLAEIGLRARVGLHVGAVTLRENPGTEVALGAKRFEVEGLAKPFAARVMALAAGGQTLLSAAARAALAPDAAAVESHGFYRLKGVEEPVEIFELGVRGRCDFVPPPDAEKAYRVVRDGALWRPLREVRHNLPAERDAFVGRAAELHELAQRLDAGARQVTVLGPAGTGKSRFVRRYALGWLGDWPGGVAFCDLSEARTLEGIHFAVGVALDIPLGPGDASAQLGHAIASRGRCLVILDNFEQVVTHAPATLGRWLDLAGQACFVVTSRERLHLAGETVVAIEPLPLEREAIELFAVRARARRADFAVTDANRAAVAEVVRLLDGLPLAIELAAARVQVLSPEQLVARMRDRFRLLGAASGAAARQATLRAAIDWSWDLLAAWEQAALAQCTVFEGGFTLDAGEAVLDLARWPEAPAAIDAIQALVDKSLLRSWVRHAAGRYDIDEPYFGMYLSIHEYAAEKLARAGATDEALARQRHGGHYAGFGSDAALAALARHGAGARRGALTLEIDNFVIACQRAVGRGDGAIAVATYRAAWEVLERQGPFALGETIGAQVLGLDAAAIEPSLHAAAWIARAQAALRAGRMEAAERGLERALELARTGADRPREASALEKLGMTQRMQGRMDAARAHLDAALAIRREQGDRHAEAGARVQLGILQRQQGVMPAARAHYLEALALLRESGDRRGEAGVLGNLANLHAELGEMDAARAAFEASLAISRAEADRGQEALSLGNLGMLLTDQGRLDEARSHLDAALAIHRELGWRGEQGIVLCNLGLVHRDQGRRAEARTHCEAALAIDREVGDRRHESFTLIALGDLVAAQGELDAARSHFERALELARAVGYRRAEGTALTNLGELLLRQGAFDAARALLVSGEAVLAAMGERLQRGGLLCVRARLEQAAGDLAAAREALAGAEAAAATIGAGANSELGRGIAAVRAALA